MHKSPQKCPRSGPKRTFLLLLLTLVMMTACETVSIPSPSPTPDRLYLIPAEATKMPYGDDPLFPQSLTEEYEQPVPIPGMVNTAGAEDGCFITPDGNTLYFFFTPDLNKPLDQQLHDGVTGLYVSHKQEGSWGEPQRIVLQDPGKLALDGCEFVLGDTMWFCSAREGYTGLHWFTAEFVNGKWSNWTNADFDSSYEVGELHITSDRKELYYGSERPGGQGGMDIWKLTSIDGEWRNPTPVTAVNSPDNEGWPDISPDGNELWFLRNYGIWRSMKVDGEWQSPEQMFSPLSGEPSVDAQGNVYFIHHYMEGEKLIEADVYVAYKK